MKDSKFIELLNLYIDHQISPADAALLESEIQQKPERRRIYREYCQMQKACMTLAENFRPEVSADDKLIEMAPSPRRIAMITYAMGIAAAAACVALVVVNRPVGKKGSNQTRPISVTERTTPSGEAIAAVDAVAAAEPTRTVLHPAFPGVARGDADASASVATADHVPLDWMNQVRLERASVDTFRFDVSPAIQPQNLALRSAQPYEAQVETTAFIFAKE